MIEILCENWHILKKSISLLEKSYKRCQKIDINKEEDIEKIETFANRYARSVDILLNKFLRSLDLVEAEEITRRLDILIRAERRGFVENYEILLEMKNLRNELAHEYIEELFLEKIVVIEEYSKKLFDIFKRIEEYMHYYSYCEDR